MQTTLNSTNKKHVIDWSQPCLVEYRNPIASSHGKLIVLVDTLGVTLSDSTFCGTIVYKENVCGVVGDYSAAWVKAKFVLLASDKEVTLRN